MGRSNFLHSIFSLPSRCSRGENFRNLMRVVARMPENGSHTIIPPRPPLREYGNQSLIGIPSSGTPEGRQLQKKFPEIFWWTEPLFFIWRARFPRTFINANNDIRDKTQKGNENGRHTSREFNSRHSGNPLKNAFCILKEQHISQAPGKERLRVDKAAHAVFCCSLLQ